MRWGDPERISQKTYESVNRRGSGSSGVYVIVHRSSRRKRLFFYLPEWRRNQHVETKDPASGEGAAVPRRPLDGREDHGPDAGRTAAASRPLPRKREPAQNRRIQGRIPAAAQPVPKRARREKICKPGIPHRIDPAPSWERGAGVSPASAVPAFTYLHILRKDNTGEGLAGNFIFCLYNILKINAVPIIALAASYFILGCICQVYVITAQIIICIVFMGLFFSIFGLFTYYMFQPYNADGTVRSFRYYLPSLLMYALCYGCIFVKADSIIFVVASGILTSVMVIMSLNLVYRISDRTFVLNK